MYSIISLYYNDDPVFIDLIGPIMPEMIAAVLLGHTRIRHILRRHLRYFDKLSQSQLEITLPGTIATLGLMRTVELLQEVVAQDPSKMVRSMPTIAKVLLESQIIALSSKTELYGDPYTDDKDYVSPECAVKVFDVLLRVTKSLGAFSLYPALDTLTKATVSCSSDILVLPFIKIIVAAIPSAPAEQTLVYMSMVASVAKAKGAAHNVTPEALGVLLEGVNIVKDYCIYSNIFQPETMKLFECLSVHNPEAFKSIATWNTGKPAKKGNVRQFTTDTTLPKTVATEVSKSQPTNQGFFSHFFSPKMETVDSGAVVGLRSSLTASGPMKSVTFSAGPTSAQLVSPAEYVTSPIKRSFLGVTNSVVPAPAPAPAPVSAPAPNTAVSVATGSPAPNSETQQKATPSLSAPSATANSDEALQEKLRRQEAQRRLRSTIRQVPTAPATDR
jgi:hypothetical protein